MITLALSKGRILEDTLPILAAAGVHLEQDPEQSRKLIFKTNNPDLQVLVIRATDVPTFVSYGAADMGVAGKDVLLEHGSADLYEPLDLRIAKCKLMTAGRPDYEKHAQGRPLRVATKYTETARQYFARQGRQVEIIKLYGSMELAPLVGLADVIVDVVDTGNTLRANGLQPLEKIFDSSARLVVNKASQKMKHTQVRKWLDLFAKSLDQETS